MLELPQYVGHPFILTSMFRFGNAGVDFFFVLSGFIIYYVHSQDLGRRERLGHYFWQRITRIYPIYWAVTAPVIGVALLKWDWASLAPSQITSSLLLLPTSRDPLLGVAWTLRHEIAFYAVFAVAIISPAAAFFIAFADLVLVTAGLWPGFSAPGLEFFQSPFHYEFAFGILAAIAVQRIKSEGAWLVGLVGFSGFLLAAWMVDAELLSGTGAAARFAFGGASCLVIIGLASAELHNGLRIPKVAVYLGAASYSIYLVHTLAIGWIARALFLLPGAHALAIPVAGLVLLLAIGAGCMTHSFVEKPLQSAVRGLRPSGPSKALRASA